MEDPHMAKHSPAHAKSGFGRYTAPKRLHPAHAAPSDGVRLTRVVGTVVGGGLLASAGFLGLATANAGAAEIIGTSPPFSSLGTTITDPDGSSATVAGGGPTSTGVAEAAAGVGTSANNDNNTAFAFGNGTDNESIAVAGEGTDANLSGNTATSVAFGGILGAAAVATAGEGTDAGTEDNTATAWTFEGEATAVAGEASFAGASGNIAWAAAQLGTATAVAGEGE